MGDPYSTMGSQASLGQYKSGRRARHRRRQGGMITTAEWDRLLSQEMAGLVGLKNDSLKPGSPGLKSEADPNVPNSKADVAANPQTAGEAPSVGPGESQAGKATPALRQQQPNNGAVGLFTAQQTVVTPRGPHGTGHEAVATQAAIGFGCPAHPEGGVAAGGARTPYIGTVGTPRPARPGRPRQRRRRPQARRPGPATQPLTKRRRPGAPNVFGGWRFGNREQWDFGRRQLGRPEAAPGVRRRPGGRPQSTARERLVATAPQRTWDPGGDGHRPHVRRPPPEPPPAVPPRLPRARLRCQGGGATTSGSRTAPSTVRTHHQCSAHLVPVAC